MKIAMFVALSIVISASTNVFSCENGFFPKNEIHASYLTVDSQLSQSTISLVKNKVSDAYRDIFNEQNKELQIVIEENDSEVNAYATRDDNNNPVIKITKGMLKLPYMTTDVLTNILCHEVGHFLGGAPKKKRGRSDKRSWSSSEGQADYYASSRCLKHVFQQDALNKNIQISEYNNHQYFNDADKLCQDEVCVRIILTSYDTANLYNMIRPYQTDLSILYKDPTQVFQTVHKHPTPQCRLDSMIAGALCPISQELTFKDNDIDSSACSSSEYTRFARPLCWFNPTLF